MTPSSWAARGIPNRAEAGPGNAKIINDTAAVIHRTYFTDEFLPREIARVSKSAALDWFQLEDEQSRPAGSRQQEISTVDDRRDHQKTVSLRTGMLLSDLDLDGKIGADPIRLPSLQPLGLKFREGWIVTDCRQRVPISLDAVEAGHEGVVADLATDH
jgi:hypothetical protein